MLSDQLVGYEWDILKSEGLSETSKHQVCPICTKKNLRFNQYKGRLSYICTCGNGDIIKFLQEKNNSSFKEIATELTERYDLRNDFKPQPKREVKYGNQPIKGTSVEDYLNNRGIIRLPQQSILYSHEDIMLSLATNHAYQPAYEHKTYLPTKDRKLYTVSKDENVSIKMFDSDTVLGVGEGIETCLSASQLYDVPVWSTLNTTFMKKFRAPRGVKILYVFADGDRNGAGHAAAFECGHKNIISKNDVQRVIIRWPEQGDFNDHLNKPRKVMEWTLG